MHPEGSYYLRSYNGRHSVYAPLESNEPAEVKQALDAAVLQNALLAAGKNAGKDVSSLLPGAVTLETHLKECIKRKEDVDEAKEMAKKLRNNCGEFLFGIEGSKTWTGLRKGITPEEITIAHLENFCVGLRANDNSKRTVKNKYAVVKQFLKFCDVVMTKKMQGFNPPKLEDKLPEYYTKAERDRFFAACETPRERLISAISIHWLKSIYRFRRPIRNSWLKPGNHFRIAYGLDFFEISDADKDVLHRWSTCNWSR